MAMKRKPPINEFEKRVPNAHEMRLAVFMARKVSRWLYQMMTAAAHPRRKDEDNET